VESEVIGNRPKRRSRLRKVSVKPFPKAYDGVKGAWSPLSLSAESETPLKRQIRICKVKNNKVMNPKAQFRSNNQSVKVKVL
jgi:hypothetical protein